MDPGRHRRALLSAAEELGARLRALDKVCRTLTLTVRYADRSATTRSRTLAEPTAHSAALTRAAYGMYEALGLQRARVRGRRAARRGPDPAEQAAHQLTFDPVDEKVRRIEEVADRVRAKFGPRRIAGDAGGVGPVRDGQLAHGGVMPGAVGEFRLQADGGGDPGDGGADRSGFSTPRVAPGLTITVSPAVIRSVRAVEGDQQFADEQVEDLLPADGVRGRLRPGGDLAPPGAQLLAAGARGGVRDEAGAVDLVGRRHRTGGRRAWGPPEEKGAAGSGRILVKLLDQMPAYGQAA